MEQNANLNRLVENLIRLGTISAVDAGAARCRVKTGQLETAWLPWLAQRAGSDRDWNPPSVGEQCLLLSPSGDPACGLVLLGLYSTTHPAPDNSLDRRKTQYRDGAIIEYDTASHTLKATLPEGGKAELVATGGVKIVGDIEVEGNISVTGGITATEDIVAGLISLMYHLTSGVDSGSGTSGVPVP